MASPNHIWAGLSSVTELAKQSDVDMCFQSVSEGKSLIAQAVTGKGVETAADATFQTMANNITNITSGMGKHEIIDYSYEMSNIWSTGSGQNYPYTDTKVLNNKFSSDIVSIDFIYGAVNCSAYDTNMNIPYWNSSIYVSNITLQCSATVADTSVLFTFHITPNSGAYWHHGIKLTNVILCGH